MNTGDGQWVALYSGGKDSAWALHQACESGLSVGRLLIVTPAPDSWLFHVPGTRWADTVGKAVGIPTTRGDIGTLDDSGRSSSAHGDHEAAELERALRRVARELDGELAGIISGAVESSFQRDRLDALSERLGIEHHAPLWQADPMEAARRMLDDGFDIHVVAVGAAGLDRSWLGRPFDTAAIDELDDLNRTYGVHPLGEGGEFETLVIDGPHMDTGLVVDGQRVWDGDRGHVAINEIHLADATNRPQFITDRS